MDLDGAVLIGAAACDQAEGREVLLVEKLHGGEYLLLIHKDAHGPPSPRIH